MTEMTQENEIPEVSVEQTIDSIASEFNVPAPAEPEPAAPQPLSLVTLDPLDESSINSWANQQNQTVSVLQAEVQTLKGQVDASQRSEKQHQVEGEITTAVTKINDGLNFDPGMVRAHLESLAANNPSFRKIWDNRRQNPRALDKVLTAVKTDIQSKWTLPSSEALEDHKAAKASQQALATKSKETDDNPLQAAFDDCKTDAERDRLWNKLRAQGAL